jgi:putative Mn2+ efflux pump MntP
LEVKKTLRYGSRRAGRFFYARTKEYGRLFVMNLSFNFFFTSIMLGVGLAMDAFSVSLANGLNEPNMKKGKIAGVAGIFAAFQGVMPLTGWLCVHTIVQYFTAFEALIPWIALGLLGFIGGKMLYEGIKNIVCTQPFGCLPNHICGKGMMKPIKEKNPDINIVAIDYDAGATAVNQENRIKLMLANSKD